MSPREYTVDPTRAAATRTGIFVRAIHPDAPLGKKYGSYDIADLDRNSLIDFLRSRGQVNEWAERVVLLIMGHP